VIKNTEAYKESESRKRDRYEKHIPMLLYTERDHKHKALYDKYEERDEKQTDTIQRKLNIKERR
jgi:hypothetical protein